MVQLSCDFEVDTCVWTDTASPDGYSWTRMSGGTPSSGTGPSGDHTGSGYYLYTEASGLPYNKLHRLESPLFSLQQDATLSFFYHMRGSDYMGTLSVEVNNNETGWSTLWSRTGDQGNSWLDAAILLPPSATQVRFNGLELGHGAGRRLLLAVCASVAAGVAAVLAVSALYAAVLAASALCAESRSPLAAITASAGTTAATPSAAAARRAT